MKKRMSLLLVIVLAIAVIANSTFIFGASNVVSQNGQLRVSNGKLCNSSWTPIQLKGMSSMGLQWYPWSANTVANLVNTWNVTIVRAAMYTAEDGYISNPTTMKNRVKTIVDAAISNGIYVIIDWHILSDGNPNTYRDQARSFFDEMSRTYGGYPNVIYEICNEPNGVDWATIKSYADYVCPTIRANDPDNIIICGTDTWSQGVLNASYNKLSYSNVMYALHFYTGTHGQWLRDSANSAMANGIAIFATEWGASEASGNGGPYLTQAQEWVTWMNQNQISWCNWSLCPKSETSAALVSGTGLDGPWSDSQLTQSGLWVKGQLTSGGGGGGGSIASGSYYKLVNVNSGKVLGIQNMSTADGGTALQWSDNGTADHNWRLDLLSNGYYKITNQNSGKVLGVNWMSTSDGAQVLQWSDNGTADHEWKFEDVGNGKYRITNKNSGKVLDVSGASTADGGNVIQWSDNGGNNQRWTLVKL